MPAMQPTADQFRSFRDDPHDGPIAQVNLLKFRVKAADGPGEPEHANDEPGTVAYQRYVDAFRAAGLLCRDLLTTRPTVAAT
ncbi:hypothetical protein [Candidatus Poriferisodalis sp.]|uniref:hypothetical protein n=1 Tax=Candidatus Poriferisodalis sp. TaxID=3101277 RepID=UPI003B0265F6